MSSCFCRLDKAGFRRFVDQLTSALEKPSNIVSEFLMLGAVEVRPTSRAASGRLQVLFLSSNPLLAIKGQFCNVAICQRDPSDLN